MADTRAFPRHTTTQNGRSARPTMCKYKARRPSPSSSPRLLLPQGQLSSLPPEPTAPTRQIVQATTSIPKTQSPALTHSSKNTSTPNSSAYSTTPSQQNSNNKKMCRKYYAHHTACAHESTIREYCEHSRVSSRTGHRVPCKRYTTAMAGITELYGGACGSVWCRVSQLLAGSGTGCCCPDGEELRRRRRRGRKGGGL